MRVCSFLFSLAEKIRFLSTGLFLLKAFFYSGTHAYYRFGIDIFFIWKSMYWSIARHHLQFTLMDGRAS